MKLITQTSLHNVIKNTTTMQNKVGFMSALLLSVLVMSSCEETLTDDSQNATPAAVDLSRVSATINQNNISVIAKSMMQTLNQINPALSDDIYSVNTNEKSGKMDNCSFSGIQYSEILKIDEQTFDYDFEFLDCQNSANDDRLLGDLSADVIFNSPSNTEQYSANVKSQIKQTNRYGIMTLSHVNSYIEVNDKTSTQTFNSKVLLDGQGTFFVKSVSLLEQDNQTQQWISGHLVLTSINEDIDVYIEQNEGLYFEYSDGVTQVITWEEINAL